MSTPKPPYNVDSLTPPFTATQRTKIIAFINAEVKANPGLGSALHMGYGISHPLANLSQLSDLGDGDLKNAYYEAVSFNEGGGPPGTGNPINNTASAAKQAATNTGILSWTDALAKFFSDLMSAAFWIRAAEVVGGLILITVGLNHLGVSIPTSNPMVKTALKVAK